MTYNLIQQGSLFAHISLSNMLRWNSPESSLKVVWCYEMWNVNELLLHSCTLSGNCFCRIWRMICQILQPVNGSNNNFWAVSNWQIETLEKVAAEVCTETSTLLPQKQIVLHGKHQSLVSFMRVLCAGLCFLSLSLKMHSSCSQRAGRGSILLTCP